MSRAPPLSFVEAKRQEVRKVQTLAADPIDPFFMDAPFSKIGTGHGDSTRGQICAVKVNLCNLLSCVLCKAAWGCNDISETAYFEPMEANGTPYDYPANTSVAYFDPARHVMDATKGDYLPIAACALASELYRTG